MDRNRAASVDRFLPGPQFESARLEAAQRGVRTVFIRPNLLDQLAENASFVLIYIE